MSFSYWEIQEWFTNVDFTIVGSGIVGLNCALHLKNKHPKAKILVLEKGMLPQGASTKNAGFACFGSLSELIDDFKKHSKEEVLNLVAKRWNGLQILRKNLGDTTIDYQQNKGYELFFNKEEFDKCEVELKKINSLLFPIFNRDVFSISENKFGFKHVYKNYIVNELEGQIDTGKMASELLYTAQKAGIKILNGVLVEEFLDHGNKVTIKTTNFEVLTKKLFIATNGFANKLLNEEIKPARAQVIITKPINNLALKGTFHIEQGYYYFRNINNRVLFGGARNIDFKTEETTKFGNTKIVTNRLKEILSTVILPETNFEIDHIWSGIMGMGNKKTTIVKPLSKNVACGIRLGGMGIAIGSFVGKELATTL